MCSVITQKLPQASISYRSKFYHINDERNIIGRDEDCFLYVRDAFVSSNHCVILQTSDNNYEILDTSITGTFVNNKRLRKHQIKRLKHKDEIKLTDKERRVPMVFLLNSQLEVNGPMKEILLDLTQKQLAEMKNIDEEITAVKSKKSCLEEENAKLEVQETFVSRKRVKFSTDVTPTREQQDEVEEKIKEIEEKVNDEKEEKMQEVELEIGKLSNKEKQLQQMKKDVEIRHQKEREELGTRWQAEINKLKEVWGNSERKKKGLNGKSKNLNHKLNLTRMLLLRSELEQYSICEEKFSLKPQQESNITDDLKEENANYVAMRKLEKKLKEKEKAEEKQKKDIADLEEELLCSICAEIFFEPKVLSCGHMFCKFCIKEWTKCRSSCPVCRATVKTCTRIHSIDSIIEKNIAMISDVAKERRKQLIKERSRVAVVKPIKRVRCCHSVTHSPRQFTRTATNRQPNAGGLVMRINQPDRGIIVFSPNVATNDVWNVSTNDQGERVYRYHVRGVRNPRPAAATAPINVPGTVSTNGPAFPEVPPPRTDDFDSILNMIDLTDQ